MVHNKKNPINREFLAYVYIRLSDIEVLCNNDLNQFIRHLQKQNKYEEVNYLLVRLSIDIFASMELIKYTYDEKTDRIFIDKIENAGKKDIHKSKIMIKLNNIVNKQ